MNEEKYNVEELLRNGQSVQFPVSGWSMYPFLSDGDTVTAEPLGMRKPRVNDVILYRRPDGPLILHRVVKTDSAGCYFCGDNQTEIEGPLPESCLAGIMTSCSRRGRKIGVQGLSYRIASSLWRTIRPLRPAISKTVHALKTLMKPDHS